MPCAPAWRGHKQHRPRRGTRPVPSGTGFPTVPTLTTPWLGTTVPPSTGRGRTKVRGRPYAARGTAGHGGARRAAAVEHAPTTGRPPYGGRPGRKGSAPTRGQVGTGRAGRGPRLARPPRWPSRDATWMLGAQCVGVHFRWMRSTATNRTLPPGACSNAVPCSMVPGRRTSREPGPGGPGSCQARLVGPRPARPGWVLAAGAPAGVRATREAASAAIPRVISIQLLAELRVAPGRPRPSPGQTEDRGPKAPVFRTVQVWPADAGAAVP